MTTNPTVIYWREQTDAYRAQAQTQRERAEKAEALQMESSRNWQKHVFELTGEKDKLAASLETARKALTTIAQGRTAREGRSEDALERLISVARAALAGTSANPEPWQPIKTAPRNATTIRVKMRDGVMHEAHWAEDISGEDQPAFRGWFIAVGNSFREIDEPVEWMPMDAPTPEPGTKEQR